MATTESITYSHAPIERTEHPHIVRSAYVLGGEPRIEDGRISVLMVYLLVDAGWTVEQIQEQYPDLTPAQIHDAASYAYDHPEEMTSYQDQHRLRTILKTNDFVYVAGRLIARDQLQPSDIPKGATVHTWETLPLQAGE